jgi:hypothetical protein
MTLLVLLRRNDSGLDHFPVKVIAFAGSLTHAGEHGVAAMPLGDVVDELHDDDRLADARTAERADLAALGEGTDEVDDLDAGFENLRGGILVSERRGLAMDGVALLHDGRGLVVDGVTGHVEDAPENFLTHGDRDRGIGVGDIHAAAQAVGAGHGHAADPAVAEVLLHFADEPRLLAAKIVVDLKRVVDRRKLAAC